MWPPPANAQFYPALQRLLLCVLVLVGAMPGAARTADDADGGRALIRIGVLSHRGDPATQRSWTPTADYLGEALPEYRFRIEPLDFAAIDAAVADAGL